MTSESKLRQDRDRSRKRLRLVSSPATLATGTAVGIGILIALYPATNRDLTGFRLLLALALGGAAVFLLIEGVNRVRASASWRLICALGAGLATVSLLAALLPASSGEAAPRDGGLRLSMKTVEPEFFTVAFEDEIEQPAADEGWLELRRRGGVDVGDSRFNLALANEGSVPISILSVHPRVVDSAPMPTGTIAWHPSQGDEAVGKMTALIASDRPGSAGQVFEGFVNPDRLDLATPYFQEKYILLKPGEVYPVELTVLASAPRSIRYRLVAEGESADRRFVAKSPIYTIVGGEEDIYQRHYARYYRQGVFATECTPTPGNPWVDASYTARSEACPDGLGSPYPVQPPSSTEYRAGKLELSLGLTPGRQSAAISGVRVGGPPAASPIDGVVRPLLRVLGAWSSCTARSPSPDYWSARWDHWQLELTFAAEGETDCTPASGSSLHRIRIAEQGVPIETELGRIELGLPWSSLPERVLGVLDAIEGYVNERRFYVRATMACPTASQPVLAGKTEPAGILVLGEDTVSSEITELASYLPASEC